MEEQDSQVRAMRARVEEVVRENERLAGDLSHHLMLLDQRAEANVNALPDEYQVPTHDPRVDGKQVTHLEEGDVGEHPRTPCLGLFTAKCRKLKTSNAIVVSILF